MQEQKKEKELRKAKQHLASIGLSYRKAAPLTGVCYQHLCDVLNGHRESRRLLNRIMELSPESAQLAASN